MEATRSSPDWRFIVTTDAWLAIAHHLAVFGVLAVLSAEWSLVRPGLSGDGLRVLARVDAAYGALAGIVLVVGVARVVAGAKPADFYTESPTFWFKMAAFATVGLLSIRPTIQYLGWRRTFAADGTTPTAERLRSAHRAVNLQLSVFGAIPVFAALMARGVGS
jgi:putative membrane protein